MPGILVNTIRFCAVRDGTTVLLEFRDNDSAGIAHG